MRLTLAAASLRRHQARTALAVAGIAVTAAMLLDMVMLATGLRESFRQLLTRRGFELRLAPRGTLPFDTEATIAGAAGIRATLRANPDVTAVSPVLGASIHVQAGEHVVTAFALGIIPAVQGDYELLSGGDALTPDAVVANDEFLHAVGRAVGDSLTLATGYNPQLRTATGERRVQITGRARFIYLAADQPAVALPLPTLQRMTGEAGADRVSLFMVRTRHGVDADSVGRWIERAVPSVSAISTRQALATMDERLRYFRQLSYILGAVSLVVGFLLVTTLMTVSVHERVGEIAVMRAIGISKGHVVQQIVAEGVALALSGAGIGLLLGLLTGRYLNWILSAFPGLPRAIDFFLFQPRAVLTALALLVVSGVLAGAYPAWRAASLPIARTLREEAVA